VNIKNYNTFVSKEITTYKVCKEMEKMESLIVKSNKTSVTNQITIPIDAKEMLTTEECIQKAVNEAGIPAITCVITV
jgi:hypothetical protein